LNLLTLFSEGANIGRVEEDITPRLCTCEPPASSPFEDSFRFDSEHVCDLLLCQHSVFLTRRDAPFGWSFNLAEYDEPGVVEGVDNGPDRRQRVPACQLRHTLCKPHLATNGERNREQVEEPVVDPLLTEVPTSNGGVGKLTHLDDDCRTKPRGAREDDDQSSRQRIPHRPRQPYCRAEVIPETMPESLADGGRPGAISVDVGAITEADDGDGEALVGDRQYRQRTAKNCLGIAKRVVLIAEQVGC